MSAGGPNFSLAGRVALVTGAGRGIGLGIARALAGAGCAVAIQDVEVEVAKAAAAGLPAPGRGVGLGGDIGDATLPARLVAEVTAALGPIDILVNNAAIQSQKHWSEYGVEEIEAQWRANLVAPILLCQRVVPRMRERRWGRILNVGSIQQLRGNPTMMPYAMGKAALENMTRALAQDLAKDGVTVNLVAPGWFNTHRNRADLSTEEGRRRAGGYLAMGRVGEPEDVAGAALMLCSDAGGYITGQSIYVDGGMSVQPPISM